MTAVAEPFDGPARVGRKRSQSATTCSQPASVKGSATGPHADSLRDIALASARLERLQWEMDSAEEELCAALRTASNASVSASALALAAGVTLPELESYLQRPAMEADSTGSYFSIDGF
ncbi:hypothetical protein FDW83_14775 [Pseudarthrobacter sp. NamE2]|uniref:hypothetical protein n=1 Tax=Pseudarthrobacter sp. NamE2 TaxID=2576838 RepID=UPI0010FF3C83|nr:hypothetical protein [Pseudarthrobacter sp. NamE2]TLM81988.1 hypothetical protein FDW83_14775 [Pseudarthrobacter sp. NamE2]